MTAFVTWLNTPLFYLDRRLPWNAERRLHHGGPFAMSNGDQALERVPSVTLVKLAGGFLIALIAVAVPGLKLLDSWITTSTDARVQAAVTAGFKEADNRYVPTQRYELRHDELIKESQRLQRQVEAADVQRTKMEAQLAQIQMTLESMRADEKRGNRR